MGYSLLINKENPLKVKVMVSHAWDEPIKDFVEAIESSGETGPFWICAVAIHQNDDESKGITIAQQLGPDPETGPFATVLKSVSVMIAVATHVCDINTKIWCVYEMHFAVSNGMRVKLCAYISSDDLNHGRVQEDICVANANVPVNSSAARCGKPEEAVSLDEKTMRKVIENSVNGYNGINESVERIRLSYLVKYPINDVEWYGDKSGAIRKIKEAIEYTIPRTNLRNDLKTYDQYFHSEKLEDDEDKNFQLWLTYILNKLY